MSFLVFKKNLRMNDDTWKNNTYSESALHCIFEKSFGETISPRQAFIRNGDGVVYVFSKLTGVSFRGHGEELVTLMLA